MPEYRDSFAASLAGAKRNVAAVMPLVVAELGRTPRTLVDVGCGPGAWVREFLSAGIDAVGFDGPWAASELVIPQQRFTSCDFENPLPLDRTYDLALSIEVAEHLSPHRGPGFVADLCALSEVVLFSAAIPGQEGENHINLRWQSHWVEAFAANGFGAIDCIRPALWDAADGVAWALAQQCFLFVEGASPRLSMPLNVVHPGLHNELTYPPRLRKLLGQLPGSLSRFFNHHAHRIRAAHRSSLRR